MTAVLGIDLGLSSARAAVLAPNGDLLGCGRAGEPGRRHVQRRASDWREAVAAAVRQAVASAGSPHIEAIGVGALGPCPVLLDARLEAIGSVPLFSLDPSAEAERQAILAREAIPEHRLGPDHVIPRLRLWQRERPRELAAAEVVVDATGYLVAWLTGRPVMDPATFIDHACAGLPRPVPLPEVLPATAVAGSLTHPAAASLGLSAGIPVAAGTYDSFADLFGMGVARPGQSGILLGSTAILGAIEETTDPEHIAAAGLRVSPHAGEGLFVGGWTSSAGSLLDWADGTFETQRAQALPGTHGLVVLPYLAGERAPHWDPSARGAIAGLSLATTRGDLRAAMTESVALSLLDLADRLEGVTARRERWIVSGGGVRNRNWLQATADALGSTLVVVRHAGEAVGPAALALAAIGRRHEPAFEAKEVAPDARRHARYRELLTIYRRLYPALRETMHELGRLKPSAKEDA